MILLWEVMRGLVWISATAPLQLNIHTPCNLTTQWLEKIHIACVYKPWTRYICTLFVADTLTLNVSLDYG